jgi:diamine N-acetyltransferase
VSNAIISFHPITRREFGPVLRLKVTPQQEDYLASNLESLAEAYVEPTWTPLAIAAGDEIVGFVMYGKDDESGRWWIMRFMIGAEHQGKRYGTEAMRALLPLMQERHGCDEIFLSYAPGNAIAERLYACMGFVPTGDIEHGEVVMRLGLERGNRGPDDEGT